MKVLGNILWALLGGLVIFLLYIAAGLIACITIIGIPFGVQLWKIGYLSLFPFGKEVEFDQKPGCLTMGFNVLWILTGWWEVALMHLLFGCICAITIIGIPFAKQHFKMMKMSFMPFGMTIKNE